MLVAFVRADFLESLKNDPTLMFQMANGKRPALYDDAEIASERQAAAWNNGSNIDPDSAGHAGYDRKKRKTAQAAATARNEGVRSNFSKKGIGDGALES